VLTDVRRFGEIDSTNTWLLAQARSGAAEGLVAVADYQRAGRGRLDRRWEAAPGAALLASVLFRPVLEPDALHLVTALVALGAARACERTAGVEVGIKWPNDLVVDDAKLAGILAEADPAAPGGPAGSVAVVVGIGLNIHPPGPAVATSRATSLADLVDAGRGSAVPVRDELLAALLRELERRRPELDAAVGRRGIAADLRRRCVTLGRAVRVELPASVLVGTATDLTDDGRLVVENDDGPHVVAAGDVVHLRAVADGGADAPPAGS
jgi:BirA family transcriptional regulator, biotin operon repressor / biotin---[acetyl-CoA-carboxylase] ligase